MQTERVTETEATEPARPERMDVRAFAERHNVRARKDSCGDFIIPGRKTAVDMPDRVEYRNHIYDGFDDGLLGLCLMFTTRKRWTFAKRKMLAAGFAIRQDGDTEGCATFDPADEGQATLAIRLTGIKTRRSPSPRQAEALAAARRFIKPRDPLRPEGVLALETEQAAK